MQTSLRSHRRFLAIKAALRGWFIKMGLIPPPEESSGADKQLSEKQEHAQIDLRFHQLPRPPRSPR
jgi:hypothetical protein